MRWRPIPFGIAILVRLLSPVLSRSNSSPLSILATRKQMAHVAQELRRRLDRGEPIEDTREWFLDQKKVWQSYFADLDPLVQWFVIDMTTDFMIWLEQKERPDKPFEEIVLERLADLRQDGDLAKPTIDRLTKLIELH
jgi:hypothetical protein